MSTEHHTEADADLATAVAAIREAGGDAVEEVAISGLTLRLKVRPVAWPAVAQVLRGHPLLQLAYPADLCGTDTGQGIVLWYRLWSFERRLTALVTIELPYDACEVPSVVSVWPGMDWHERECFDMLGVAFPGHPRMAEPSRMRILLSEDWVGHPFRHDYVPQFSGDPLHGPQETN